MLYKVIFGQDFDSRKSYHVVYWYYTSVSIYIKYFTRIVPDIFARKSIYKKKISGLAQFFFLILILQ
jgi:hypothetical protein